MLRIAALGGAAIVTVRPGIAQAAASVITCSINVPNSANSGKWIKNSDGTVVAKNTSGAIAGPSPAALPGTQVKATLADTSGNTTYTGYTKAQTTTWNKYITKLTQGTEGFTCYASIQNPR